MIVATSKVSFVALSFLVLVEATPLLAAPSGATTTPLPEDLTQLDVEDLVNIKVANVGAASRFEQKVTSAPSSVSIITADDIQKFGWRTLADVLGSLRGFYVTYDRNYHYLGVRGFGRPGDYNSRILLLVDGHQVNDDIFDQAYIGTDFILDLDLVDRIEVVRGPVSALYGGNAFFGVIDVKTKTGAQVGGIEGAAGAGSFDAYKARLTWGHAFESGPDVVASGTWYQCHGSNLYFKEFDAPATNRGWATGADYDRAPSFLLKAKWLDVMFTAANVNREKGIPTASYESVFNDRRSRTIDMRSFAEARYEHQFADHLNLMARAFYDQYDYLGYYAFNYGTAEAPWNVVNNDQAHGKWWGIEANVSKLFFERFRLMGGIEFKHVFQQDQRNWDVTQTYLDERHDSKILASYAQGNAQVFRWLALDAAVRVDRYDEFGVTANPRTALVITPAEAIAFKYIFGRAFRPPNEYELHYKANGTKQPKSLDPETIMTHELVYEHYLTMGLRWAVSAFYSDIDNLISLTTDQADHMMVFVNSGSITSVGAEAEIEYRSPWGLLARGSYAWQRSVDNRTDDGLTNSPAHMVKAAVSVPLWRDNLFLSGEEEFLSARTALKGYDADAHALTNLTLLWRGLPRGLFAIVSVYNLFDEIYGDPGSEEHAQDMIYQDGRTFRLALGYTY